MRSQGASPRGLSTGGDAGFGLTADSASTLVPCPLDRGDDLVLQRLGPIRLWQIPTDKDAYANPEKG